MSRNIKEIYRSAIEVRNKYLQLTPEKTDAMSASKMSVMNVLTYVMSSLIYAFENMLDVFLADATKVINQRTNGTPEYYVFMAKHFSRGCTVKVNDDGTGLDVISAGNKELIPYASYETVNVSNGIVLKVCKDVNGNITPLSADELSEVKAYIGKCEFVGASVAVRSVPADLLTLRMRIVYDDTQVSAEEALANIKESIDGYAKGLTYDDYVYQSAIIDAVQSAFGILDVPSTLSDGTQGKILVQKNNYAVAGGYDDPVEITGWYRPYSGYLTTMVNGATTINTDNIELQSRSEYLTSSM